MSFVVLLGSRILHLRPAARSHAINGSDALLLVAMGLRAGRSGWSRRPDHL